VALRSHVACGHLLLHCFRCDVLTVCVCTLLRLPRDRRISSCSSSSSSNNGKPQQRQQRPRSLSTTMMSTWLSAAL